MARGGKRPGAGRPRGKINKEKREIQEIAREYTAEALETLVAIMRDPEEPGKTRTVAANAILDRGHGKPTQTVDGQLEGHFSYDVPWLKNRGV